MNLVAKIIFLISCLTYFNVVAQSEVGSIQINSEDLCRSKVQYVDIELYSNDSLLVSFGKTDSTGFLKINEVQKGIYYLIAIKEGYTSFQINNLMVDVGNITFLTIELQTLQQSEITNNSKDSYYCSFYMGVSKPKCPICGTKKNIIPYVHQEPNPDLLKKNEKGLIILVNCRKKGCSPSWHCKKHKIDIEKT